MHQKTMRGYWLVVMLVALVVFLAGCPSTGTISGNNDSTNQDSNDTSDASSSGPIDGQAGLVANIYSSLSDPPAFAERAGNLYFAPSYEQLWQDDGATAEKVLSTTDEGDPLGSADFEDLSAYNGMLYFLDDVNGVLYQYDGQNVIDVTTLVTDDNGFVAGEEATVYDGKLYVTGNGKNGSGDDTGVELWAYDASAKTIALVANLRDDAAAQNSFPSDFFAGDTALYFTAIDDDGGRKLWKYTGSGNPQVVADGGSATNFPDIQSMAMYDGDLYLAADSNTVSNSSQYELYRLDETETAAGALEKVSNVSSGFDGDNDVDNLFVYDEELYFSAEEYFYRYDRSSVTQLADVVGESGKSLAPEHPVVYDGNIYFSGKVSDFNYRELWRFDGSDTAATLVWDVDGVADESSHVSHLYEFDGKLFFYADDALRYYAAP